LERRNYNRSPVKLSAIVHDKMYRSWDFSIENFGFDGLRLDWKNKELMPTSLEVDDLLQVKFRITQDGDIKPKESLIDYHLEVKIVRVLEKGLAVTLFNPALDAIASLSKNQLSKGLHESASFIGTLDKRSHNILNSVRVSFIKSMSNMTDVFFPIVHDSLFKQAETSNNNSDQAIYFDAINTLNKSQHHLKNEFISLLEKQFNLSCDKKKTPEQDEQNGNELELIDQNEFENWLAVNQLIVDVSPHYEQELFEIELRLTKLVGVEASAMQHNPFSPEIIFNTFSEAIHKYFLNNDILLILYRQFESVVNNNIFDVYNQINQIFIEENILPIIEENKLKVKKAPSPTEHTKQESPQVLSNQSSSPGQVPNRQATNLQATTNQASMAHLSEINAIQNDVNLVPTYQTLKELISFKSGHGLEKTPDDFFASDEYKTQLNYLISELTQLQYEQAKKIAQDGIKPFDFEALASKCINKDCYSIELKNEFDYTLDVIKRLFTSILNDDWLGAPVKKLLSVLQIPLLKVSLLHKNFFESWDNPARILINKLALVDFDDEKSGFYLKAHSFVLFILKNYENDLEVFTKVQKVLTELLEIQSRHYKKNVNHVVTQWNAQQAVISELASRLANKPTPVSIADFISYQWLTILVSTYLKYGKDSSQWSQYLQALDMLILSMGNDISEDFIDKDVILFVIKQGLEENDQFNKKTLDNIESFLTDTHSGHDILLNHDSIVKLLINGYALSDKTAISRMSQGATDAFALANKGIAQRLKINDYLIFKKPVKVEKSQNQAANSTQVFKDTTRLQYIWSSDAQNVFVFSDRTGQQYAVFNLSEIIKMLDSGQLTQTHDYDLPLLERSLYAILGDIHDDLAQDETLDGLTGLLNKREFLRLMKQKFSNRQKKLDEFTIVLINIDQFSLINDTCGYEAGDKYIVEIAHAIKPTLASNILCARYSVDELILQIPSDTDIEAVDISDQLRNLIQAYQF